MPDTIVTRASGTRADVARDVLCGAILAAAFVLFAWLSWRTWPDVLVDFGQELYVPWRLSAGDVLYRDIAWVTGPLSQYANALLFRLFGVSLTTVIFSNLTLLAAIVAMLYWLLRQCGSRLSATVACLFFLAAIAFGQDRLIGNYNYICPYRHDITHGLALGLINLLCLVKYQRTQGMRWLVASGMCLGLVALTKIEMTLAMFLTTAAALVLFTWQKIRRDAVSGALPTASPGLGWKTALRELLRGAGIVTAAALVPIAIAVGALAIPLGWTSAFGDVFLQYRLAFAPELAAGSAFYRAVSGTDQTTANLLAMITTAVIVLGAVIAGYVIEIIMGRWKPAGLWATVLGITAAWAARSYIGLEDWTSLPGCLPLLLVPVILIAFRGALREADGPMPRTVLFLLAIYGLVLLPKILLLVRWGHYGFVLAVPATLVAIHVAVHSIPESLQGNGRKGWCFRAVVLGLLFVCAASLVFQWLRIDAAKTAVVGQEGDRFYAEPREDGRVLPTLATLKYLRDHLRADDTLVVFPNGVILNYLLRARNPTPYIMFSPWESDVHGGEDRIADAVIRAAPDYAVIVTMDLTIHGRGNFGDPEFGGRIRKFLDEQYDVVDEQISAHGHGGVDGRFASTVFKRRVKRE